VRVAVAVGRTHTVELELLERVEQVVVETGDATV
jgi:hypothetical protein